MSTNTDLTSVNRGLFRNVNTCNISFFVINTNLPIKLLLICCKIN